MFSKISFLVFVLLISGYVSVARAATFTVTLGADSDNGACGQFCTLRDAINAANANGAGADTIKFNVNPAVATINVFSALPAINTSLTIDGTSQPGYFGTPIIAINGAGTAGQNGLLIESPASNAALTVKIQGIAVHSFDGSGVLSSCSGECDVTLLGNRFGTSTSGQIDLGNDNYGVSIFASANSDFVIGGTGTFESNLMSGNEFGGLSIRSFINAPAGNATAIVQGNYIGTNAAGTADLGNTGSGITVWSGTNSQVNLAVTIGGETPAARNVISGNNGNGILLLSHQTFIYGNYIGTNAAGNADLGNSQNGIKIQNTAQTLIGNKPARRNVISGNGENGILAQGGEAYIYNNYIGTNAAGTADLGNSQNGVSFINTAKGDIGDTLIEIGSPPLDGGNVISGNDVHGVSIVTTDMTAPLTIARNRIGTNAAGTAALGNTQDGIFIQGDAAIHQPHLIGSHIFENGGNLISGNGSNGIQINPGVSDVEVYGNKIGTNLTATAKIPNQENGIALAGGGNKIGRTNFDPFGNNVAANTISGNAENGIWIYNSVSSNNRIYHNFIGTNAAGDNLGNTLNGVLIGAAGSPGQAPSNNKIGGAESDAGNVIAYNGGDGVNILFGNGNRIERNSIYSNGGLGIDLGADGVMLIDANDADSGANNLQNFPLFVNASPAQVAGNIISVPNKPVTLDFYRVDSCDASGNGEGRYYLASKIITVTNNGIAYFNYQDIPLTVGQIITATATDENGNTSEFSPCYTANPPPGVLSFSSATYSVNEAAGTRTIVVNRTNGSYGTIQVNYEIILETATIGVDFTAANGTLVFNNGETVKTFDIQVADDAKDEADETVKLKLSFPTNGSWLVNPNTAILTIVDNESPPKILIKDVSQSEGNNNSAPFVFEVSLSEPSDLPIFFDYATANGTATATSDYFASNGTVSFAPGQTVKNIEISVSGDPTVEFDETFFVNLSNPTNATIADNQATGTILDDDNPGRLSFSAAAYSGTENDSVQITVLRTNGATGTISVDYATTGGGTATSGGDYTPVSGNLIFLDGETSKTFNVNLTEDANPEPIETVNLVLSNPIGGATLGAGTATLNILDNDKSGLSINGAIHYGVTPPNQPQKTVSGVSVSASGASIASDTTDSSGAYSLGNLQSGGQYIVTLSKTGNINGISPFDATLILRHVAANGQGPNALNPNQQKAADANGNGSISPFDATQILRFVAANGKTPNTGAVGNWEFLPSARNYDAVNNSLTEQNYEAVLIGDVNGNWTPPVGSLTEPETPAVEETETQNQPDTVSELESTDSKTDSKTDDSSDSDSMMIDAEISLAADSRVSKDGTILIPVRLINYTGKNVSAYNFEVQFDSDALQPDAAHPIEQNETLSKGFAIVHNTDKRSRIGIAASGGANRNQAGRSGILLYLRFKIKEAESYPIGKAIRLTFTKKPVFEDENGCDITVNKTKDEK
ncbi:MAG TPA: Calx-beta domain-containing protein [Pyrinomonadaceae bacterium]|jgi:CSLREA domain-containing protein